MENVPTARLLQHLIDGVKIGTDTGPYEDDYVVAELLRRLYGQSEPCTLWGESVERRLESLEEEVEAGLSSLGKQVDDHHRHVLDLVAKDRGLIDRPASPMPRKELRDGIMRHLEKTMKCLEKVEGRPDQRGRNENWIEAAKVHLDTAEAMSALLVSFDG